MSAPVLKSKFFPFRPGLIAGVVMAVLCLLVVAARPLFHDEASTIYFAGSTPGHLADMIRQDIHPPLYFVVAWGWMKAFGESVMALRVLSVVFMAAAVGVFVRAVPVWTGRGVSLLAAACVGAFPFFALCGYFARYYSLTCLLWACCFWAAGRAWRTAGTRACVALGVLLAAQLLVNYVAAVLTVLSFLPLFWRFIMRRQWRALVACALPGLVAFGAWLPVLWGQLSADLPGRIDAESGLSLMQLIKSGGFLAWTLTVSDGLPPWNPVGLVLVPLVLLLTTYHVLRATVSPGTRVAADDSVSVRTLVAMALVPLGAAAVAGWVLLPGAMYTFLPPRVAVCGFPFLILAVVIPDLTSRFRRITLGAVLVVNVIASGFLLTGGYTNWAYVVPAREIATSVMKLSQSAAGPTLVYLPEKSMRNVKHYLEPGAESLPEVQLLPRDVAAAAGANSILIVRQSRSPEWPPAAAVHDDLLAVPAGKWHRTDSVAFLEEKQSASRLKAVISGRDVHPDKIRAELWQRTTNPK